MTAVIEPLRAIVPATADAVRDLAYACSPATLQRRFFLPAPLDRAAVLARLGHYLLAGPPDGVAAVATAGGRPVGLLNVIAVGDRTVEVSLLVADAWQRQGVAGDLLDHELRRPRWAGWTVRAMIQPGNRAALALLRTGPWSPPRVVDRDPSAWDFAAELAASRVASQGPDGRPGR